MIRQVAFLMRASKGALTHAAIMALSWRQFGVYIDSFTWLLREEGGKEGQKKNQHDDHEATRDDPRIKARRDAEKEEARRKLDEFNSQWDGKKGQATRVN